MKKVLTPLTATWLTSPPAQINQLIGAPQPANFVTGVAADNTESVAIVGRNLGSGTRANALLNYQYGINNPVDQFAYNVSYTGSGLLTQNTASYVPDANGLVEVFNDGFDSGGNVAKELNVDGSAQQAWFWLVILGIS